MSYLSRLFILSLITVTLCYTTEDSPGFQDLQGPQIKEKAKADQTIKELKNKPPQEFSDLGSVPPSPDCSRCKEFEAKARILIKNMALANQDKAGINQPLKKEISQSLGGVRVFNYSKLLDDERELEIAEMILSTTDWLNKNNKLGVKITASELTTLLMMEGLVLKFIQQEYELPIDPDKTEVTYKGKKYKIEKDENGQAFFKVTEKVQRSTVPITDDQNEITLNNKKYKVKSAPENSENEYLPPGINYVMIGEEDFIKLNPEIQESLLPIHTPEGVIINSLPLPEGKSVQLSGKTYPIKVDKEGFRYIEPIETHPKYRLPIEQSAKKVVVNGEELTVRKDKKGALYYWGQGEYYSSKNSMTSGISHLGTDVIGNFVTHKGKRVPFIKKLMAFNLVPSFVQFTQTEKQKVDGHNVRSADFPTMEYGIFAAAGMYAWTKYQTRRRWNYLARKRRLAAPVRKSWSEIPNSLRMYWSNYKYNTGNLKGLSRRKGLPQPVKKSGKVYSFRAFLNNGRRLATYLWLDSIWDSETELSKNPEENKVSSLKKSISYLSRIAR